VDEFKVKESCNNNNGLWTCIGESEVENKKSVLK
jgi:hypothetical protein